MTKNDTRTRNFATVVYPDSAPENWQDILLEQFVPAFISPLHDQDVNPGGELKKPHWHVMLMFEGKKSVEQAILVFDKIGGVGCDVVQSQRGYARYLCHLDNPEKFQYSSDDVCSFGGADYIYTIGLIIDKFKAVTEMEEFSDYYNVLSYSLLSKYARIHKPTWHRALCTFAAYHMIGYLKARAWSNVNGQEFIIDPVTGEILI